MTIPLSETSEYQRFWKRVDTFAALSFRLVPLIGPTLADFFNNTILPTFSGPRDRLFSFLLGGFFPRRSRA